MKWLAAVKDDLIDNELCKVFFAFILMCLVPSMSSGADFTAEFIKDYGYVSLIKTEGAYDADGSVEDHHTPRREITKAFYTEHSDDFDFLVIFTDFDFNMPEPDVAAFYTGVRNDVQGIGLDIRDNSAVYGSNGVLQGTIDMGFMDDMVLDPSEDGFDYTMGVLSHELYHRWGVHVRFIKDGTISDSLIGKDESHWSYLFDTRGSLQYGNTWQDNGDGTFTSLTNRKYFSKLDLYLMGFAEKSEVDPMLLIENEGIDPATMPEEGVTINGEATYVTIEKIVEAEGERVPSYADSQKTFKIGYILASRSDTATNKSLQAIKTVIENWEVWFSSLTHGRALVYTDWEIANDIPENETGGSGVYEYRETADINDGLNWLKENQKADGTWRDSDLTPERDTPEAVKALSLFENTESYHNAAISWLAGNTSSNLEYLSEKLMLLSAEGMDVSAYVAQVVGTQNSDGGWGSNPYYESNALDTALAIHALLISGASDAEIINPATEYLQLVQRADGGWGNIDSKSDVATTSSVLSILTALNQEGNIDTEIQSGLSYLISIQNADDGFGVSGSTVYEAARVGLVLSDLGLETDALERSIAYIGRNQLIDGSWENSAYKTAQAIRVLSLLADLSIADPAVEPSIITDVPSELLITANVQNTSQHALSSVNVSLYAGSVADSNKVDETTIDIPKLSSTSLSFTVSLNDTVNSLFYIVVDPDDLVLESNKTNNTANVEITYEITTFIGDDGDNSLTGNAGDNTIDGGAGNDSLDGGGGNDTFIFGPGYGVDTIYTSGEPDGIDVVKLVNLTQDDVRFARSDSLLFIYLQNSDDYLRINNFFSYSYYSGGAIDEIHFDDGTVLTVDDIKLAVLVATEENDRLYGYESDDVIDGLGGNDYIYGEEGNDTLHGGSGDDSIYGNEGDDILSGGPGNDLLAGGTGNDIYRYTIGDGYVRIYETRFDLIEGDLNIVELPEGITPDDITLDTHYDKNLILRFGEEDDELFIIDYLQDSAKNFYEIRFSGGAVWHWDTVRGLLMNPTTDGDDIIRGFISADELSGGDGNDELYGQGGADILDGGPGDDHLEGGKGIDIYLFGFGYGHDIIFNGVVEDGYNAEDSFDVVELLEGIGPEDVVLRRVPQYAIDWLPATGSSNRYYFGDGDALVLYLKDSDDQLVIASHFYESYGSRVSTEMYEIHFSDGTVWSRQDMEDLCLVGTDDNDTIWGHKKDDTISGEAGDDSLYGGSGNDTIDGGEGMDTIEGGDGNDTLYGGPGEDTLYGNYGNDTFILQTGTGEDTVVDMRAYGTTNMDKIFIPEAIQPEGTTFNRSAYTLFLTINNGSDTLIISNYFTLDEDNEYPDDAGKILFSNGGSLSLNDVRTIISGKNVSTVLDDELFGDTTDDVIAGDSGNDTILGDAGNDTLSGGEGDDSLFGDGGNDILSGGNGIDALDGGDGEDTLNGDAGNDTLDGGQGNDTLNGGSDNDTLDGGQGDDTLIGGAGDDVVQDAYGSNFLYGNEGNDTLYSGVYNDTLDGGAGDDILYADRNFSGAGDNIMIGGLGNDTLYGSHGSETYVFNAGDGEDLIVEGVNVYTNQEIGDDILEFGEGINPDDVAVIRMGYDLIVEFASTPTDKITIENWFMSSSGIYRIETVGFFDGTVWDTAEIESRMELHGTSEDDVLFGFDDRDDYIMGLGGDDYLDGQSGDDFMRGGTGNDIYIFSPGSGHDTIDNQDGGTDWLLFTDSLTEDVLEYYRDGDDLVINVTGSDDMVTVLNWFEDEGYQLTYIQPSGGYGIPATEINDLVNGNEEGFDLMLRAGLNLFAYPVMVPSSLSAFELLEDLGGESEVVSVLHLDSATQTYEEARYDGGSLQGVDFSILDGEGYLVNMVNDRDMTFPGESECLTYDLAAGVNLIGIPCASDGFSSYALIESIGDDTEVSSVQALSSETGQFNTTVFVNGMPAGPDFPVKAGDAFYVYMKQAKAGVSIDPATSGDTGQEGEELIPDESTFDFVNNGTEDGEQVVGTSGNDLLKGYGGDDLLFALSGSDWVSGGDGDDYIDGGEGDDFLLGGPGGDQLGGDAGNDFMRAGSGDDIYVYRPGSGADDIDNQDGGVDWLIFTDDLTIDRLVFIRSGDDLIVRIDSSQDTQVRVINWFNGEEYQVDYIQPAGGYGIAASTVSEQAVIE